jgi:ParB family chromosome partitioning protein
MKLAFIDHDKLFVDKTNMRYGKKVDVTDILPSVRKRGVIVPLIVKPANDDDRSGIVAGARRLTANGIALAEGFDHGPLPCAILEDGDDAAAIEASLIENIKRLAPDEVTQWENFARLVKEGRDVEDISETFGIPELIVQRVLALGSLLPRIRNLYRKEKIDRATVRHLTLASKSQQKAWLGLYNDPEAWCPTGNQLKSWLFGGTCIPVKHALFDTEGMKSIVADLFETDSYFADIEAFWTAQNAAIEERRETYLDEGWSDVIIVSSNEHFYVQEYVRTPKNKGGRVYINVRPNGEVAFHEGYVTGKEAKRLERGEKIDTGPKTPRPEVTSTMQTYIDLHRHAAVRAALCRHPKVALRMMVAHVIVGSWLWRVQPEPQTTRNDAVRASIEASKGEMDFATKRRAVRDLLGFAGEEPAVTGGNSDPYGLVGVFLRLLDLPDRAVMDVIVIVMGETLAAGSAAVEAVGSEIGVDMARYWQADDAFFELLRDKEVSTRIVAEVGGEAIASANAGEKAKTLKRVIRDYLDGANGRPKVDGWVPRWLAFPPSAYTARGGVGTVEAAELVAAARADNEPEPDGPGTVIALPPPAKTEPEPQPEREAA